MVVLEHGAIDVLDPLVHQRSTLAQPAGVTFDNLAISADGRRVLAYTDRRLLAWTIERPASALATAAARCDDQRRRRRSPGGSAGADTHPARAVAE